MKLRRVLGGALAVVLSLAVGILALELLARAVWGEVTPGYRFFSQGTYVRDECGAVHYAADRVLRTAAVFGAHVAYDVRFQTNNLGFVDVRDYVRRQDPGEVSRRVAFVGDSFTAGFHPGKTWVARVRERLGRNSGTEVYNLGVGGTGLAQFETVIRCADERLHFNEVVVSAITHDVFRGDWRPLEHAGMLYFCNPAKSDAKCLKKNTRLIVLENDEAPRAALTDRVARVARHRVGFEEYLTARTHVGTTLMALRQRFRERLSDEQKQDVTRRLRVIREQLDGRRVVFLHLPMKEEVERGQYTHDLAAVVAAAGVGYYPALHDCEFTPAGFFEEDGHPNATGSEQIAECALDVLQPARSARLIR